MGRLVRIAIRGMLPLLTVGGAVFASSSLRAESLPVNFSRDIRPIFSDNCFKCHGPDEAERPTDFRLDTKDGAFEELGPSEYAIVPGDSAQSVLYRRISSKDEDERMPPVDCGKKLTPKQIALIKTWIDQGASWREHWSFVAPKCPPLPSVQGESWIRNPIDRFILARLEHESLHPSPEADKRTLIRRVTLDLTGLPPTIEEVDAFLRDDSADAYENLVEQLLNSNRYGEHMARYWLDAARYGDTHGLHLDNERSIWPYRDWVISAFNRNMPFDEFTIEQLAGDLLPNPTLEQRVATGFNRCNVSSSEGGSIPEELRVRYAVDRVETTSTVWMGLTLGCAVCHDHKFDPFKQTEFYRLFAYFNSLADNPMDGNAFGPPPVVQVPTPEQSRQLKQLRSDIAEVQAVLDGPMPEIDAQQREWEREWAARFGEMWRVLKPVRFTSTGGASLEKLEDDSILASGVNPDKDIYEVTVRTEETGIAAFRLEVQSDGSLPHLGPGRADDANFMLSEFEVAVAPVDSPDEFQPVEFMFAQAERTQAGPRFQIEQAIDGKLDPKNGWAIGTEKPGESCAAVFVPAKPVGFSGGSILRFRLRHESELAGHGIGRFQLSLTTDESVAPTTLGPWYQLGPYTAGNAQLAYEKDYGPEGGVDLKADYHGKKFVAKPKLADGLENQLPAKDHAAYYLFRTIRVPASRKMTLMIGSDDAVKVWLNGNVVLDKNVQRRLMRGEDRLSVELNPGENQLLMKVVNYTGEYAFSFEALKEDNAGELLKYAPMLAKAGANRSDEETKHLRDHYRSLYSPTWIEQRNKRDGLEKAERELNAEIPITMVMQEMEKTRPAYVLTRGQYDQHGEPVEPGIPAVLPPLPADAPPNRLALARWLVNPSHPLTARVTVNRLWQQYFGTGIVKTTEDFGSQGEWPSHPELLDWLACEFTSSGWDVKHMVRLIVTSAAYRQSSVVSAEGYDKDRENRLISRGPRYRLDAEMIRDLVLYVSGMLVEQVGGKSVKPYQPKGLWEAVGFTSSNTAKFVQDEGAALYRRSMYTFWKRTSPPPSMLTLDAPSRESCVVRRSRTNTPLQALVLMNDVQFVEAARHLAQRMMIEGGAYPEDRVDFAFQLATSRHPDADEMRLLLDVYRENLAEFQQNKPAADELIHFGDTPCDESVDAPELAAWTLVANMILNLHETVTKG